MTIEENHDFISDNLWKKLHYRNTRILPDTLPVELIAR